ncbi:MAG: FAD-binding oxidoreductase [Euzebya sp.]
MSQPSDLIRSLHHAVGAAHVLTDPQARRGFEVDWTGRFSGQALAVVRPADTRQVSDVVTACAAAGVGIVPQGGNTGLVGGGVPRGGEVVLSLTRLDHIAGVDTATPCLSVGAGARLAAVAHVVGHHGLAVGVDLAARESATIGGMVATNAGGVHVVAHGSMRQRVMGLEAVLADGTVLRRLPGLTKDNAGYDLPQLLAGSEGTLGIITAVSLRLVRRTSNSTVLLVGCEDVADAVAVSAAARGDQRLQAVEMMRDAGVRLVCQVTGVPPPLQPLPPVMLLLEFAGQADVERDLEMVGNRPAVLAQDESDRRRLWHYREGHTEAINSLGVPLKLDVTVPLPALPDVIASLDRLVPEAIIFGHLADGNLHINLPDTDAQSGSDSEAAILRLVAANGGSIASEHGIGVAKVTHLHLTRDQADLAAMRAIKTALDPRGIMNPGVLFAR